MENSWSFLFISTEIRHYQKKAGRRKTLQLKFEENGKSEEYKVEAIRNSAVNVRELESSQFSGLYYLIS